MEDQLDSETKELLCAQMGIPPEDFGLTPESDP
jgi:hypothetical protein